MLSTGNDRHISTISHIKIVLYIYIQNKHREIFSTAYGIALAPFCKKKQREISISM
jgi:hypothetical protein